MKNILRFVVLLPALCFTVGLNSQQLSRQEKKLVATVAKNNSEAVAFLEKVANMNTMEALTQRTALLIYRLINQER